MLTLSLLICSAIGTSPLCYADPSQMVLKGFTEQQQQDITPQQALTLLKEGNQRFTNDQLRNYDFASIRKKTADSQFPFAVVLTCLDSRSSPDIVFDQGIGKIFIGRVAGNVVNTDLLGSMEFATGLAGAKLIVVMGHTSCGAVAGACAGAGTDNLKKLLSNIQPAVNTVQQAKKGSCEDMKTVNAIAKQNVINQVKKVYQDSPVIKRLIDKHQVLLVGAMHNLATGNVDFFYQFKPAAITS